MKKRIRIYIYIIAVLLMGTILASADLASQINWYSYEEGMALGLSENKKVFISFYADWCKFCKTMDRKTFQNGEIIFYLNANFISIKVNVEREKSVAREYNINPLPDSWFLSEKGDVIGNKPGYLTAEDLMPVLKFIHTDSFQKMSYRQFKESL